MGFWIYMLVIDMLIPATMLFFGRRFYKAAPREINSLYGYRTKRSMRNRETWEFSHKYCGRLWQTIGAIMLPLSLIGMLFVVGKGLDYVALVSSLICLVQLVVLIGSIIPCEAALKKAFDDNGRRR
ncbi:SdpI family protein [Clostridiaceae bacterium OttesenSCG-928-D20]|nr:SdpI family protein [Clostridiaceae bacterium OttesenSCG-928-D20]